MPAQKRIIQYLVDNDRRLKTVTQLCPYPCSRKNTDIYMALLSSIVSQQLSVKAADTIFNRFLDIYPDRYPPPGQLIKTTSARLRTAGLSQQKAQYLKNVASFALEDDGLNYHYLRKKTDEELISHLTQIKGVGRWTVEMLLMFTLDRKDVLPVNDLGIQQAIKKLYKLDHEGKELKQKMVVIAENWKPYRSIVCKYLWHWKSLP
jgi:DNA-3-methyladenine glycosylase II